MSCQRKGRRTLEFLSLGGLVVDVDTLDIALHFSHKELGDGTFCFCTLCRC